MILVIDNYDSFAHNLARYFRQLGCATLVVRNDRISIEQIEESRPHAIVISPGPCTPNEAGCSLDVIQAFSGRIPILGICLGHQAIFQAFGGRILRSAEPVHGQSSPLNHAGHPIFESLPSPILVGRYHSLIVDRESMPDCLEAIAWLDDGTIMAVVHRQRTTVGLQFHPESVLTEGGYKIIRNFLIWSGVELGIRVGEANVFASAICAKATYVPSVVQSESGGEL
jgi:anthranilate synthase/aminodeoxychorismate synthase-like glutamine amidotransferase